MGENQNRPFHVLCTDYRLFLRWIWGWERGLTESNRGVRGGAKLLEGQGSRSSIGATASIYFVGCGNSFCIL
jgi:hypothetical protein